MYNKTNDSGNEVGNFTWPTVFDYKSQNALFVLCETSDGEQCHIKFRFEDIVCIQRNDRADDCIIISKDSRIAALATFTDILNCLPPNMFSQICWNEVLNLSLVDRIDANILYVGRTPFYVDKKYAGTVLSTFHMVDKESVREQEPSSYNDSIFLRVGECYRRIKIADILWIESYHNYCDIHLKNSTRPYCSVFPLTAWQRILPNTHFLRLHRSLIINSNSVDVVESKTLSINEKIFNIPKAHRHIIPQYFKIFQRKMADGILCNKNN